ncbi:MAG: GNAT family N-acetyltransferase [Flavobacteriales bacterium]
MRLIPIPLYNSPGIGAMAVSPLITDWVRGNQTFYTVVGFKPPWIAYLAVETDAIVGTCAFKGKPRNNVVEIAYGTHTSCEGKGIATRMAAELVQIARSNDPTVRIIAQTLPEHNASTRVLTKNGFTHVRDAVDDEVGNVWEWELTATGG